MNQKNTAKKSATILIVDDEREIADSYAETLRSEYAVITAYSGKAALEEIDSGVDVALLDRRMPDLSGDEVLAEIRSRDIDCRVVMVTAVDPDIDIISLDFDDYLVKPVSGVMIQDAVERMLARTNIEANLQNAFSLASKMATLEAKMDIEELEASEEYEDLEARFSEYRKLFAEIDPNNDLYAKLSTTKMKALFADK